MRALSIATPCMSGEPFTLDTNILVYSIDRAAGLRHDIAKTIMQRASRLTCCLTLQSISEFYVVVTRKGMMPSTEAISFLEATIELFTTLSASARAVRAALALAASNRASYWDALLLTTAAEAGCTAILTEDLADGATLAGIRVINPFGADWLTPEADALLTEE